MLPEAIEKFFERMEERDDQRAEQTMMLLTAFKKDFNDHDLLVRLDEKFNQYAQAELEYRERQALAVGAQHERINKAEKNLTDHEAGNAKQFNAILRFQYIQTGAILLFLLFFNNFEFLERVIKAISGH